MKNEQKTSKKESKENKPMGRVLTYMDGKEILAFRLRCLNEGTTVAKRLRELIATHMKGYKPPKG